MRKIIYSLVLVLIITGLTACSQKQEKTTEAKLYKTKIYYLNNAETKLVSEGYSPKSSVATDLVDELLDALDKKPENLTYKKVKPDNITVKEFNLNENGQLTLNFNSNYQMLTGVSEILCRAAIVKTLCQIDGVESVEFYVDGQPLILENEKPFGFMEAQDFIDNSDGKGNSNQYAVMTLFFANQEGDRLVECRVKVKYDGTMPMEQLIIEQIMGGPDRIEGLKEGTLFPTIPKDTVLLNTSIKDGVCYVDFNDAFLKRPSDTTGSVVIYSIVNSLVEMANVNKVQFTINGEQVKSYGEKIKFDEQFERNFEVVAKKE